MVLLSANSGKVKVNLNKIDLISSFNIYLPLKDICINANNTNWHLNIIL